jgi:hypothetical protein
MWKHSLFWFISAVLLVAVFGLSYGNYINSFYFVTFLLPVAIGTSLFFNHYLVPGFLLKRKYIKFWVYTFYTIIASLYLEMIVITLSFVIIANYNYSVLDPLMTNIFVLAAVIYLIVLINAFTLLYLRFKRNEFKVEQLISEKKALKTEYITVRADRANQQIELELINYMESMGDYVQIHTKTRKIMTLETISYFEKTLPESFLRIHRSYIVNRGAIEKFGRTYVKIPDKQLPISRTYKASVQKILSQS